MDASTLTDGDKVDGPFRPIYQRFVRGLGTASVVTFKDGEKAFTNNKRLWFCSPGG